MANINAIVDLFQHPDIPYFDPEHLIVGNIAGAVAIFFLILIEKHTRHLEILIEQCQSTQKELEDARFHLEIRVQERTEALNQLNSDLHEEVLERKTAQQKAESTAAQLEEALAQVKTLGGLLPICASCHKIRDDQGYWNRIEKFIQERSDVKFSHGICPECKDKLYGNLPEND